MVELKKLEEDLNHIDYWLVSNAEIPIGGSQVFSETEVELFSRKLVLSNNLERVPVLVGMSGTISLSGVVGDYLSSAGMSSLGAIIRVYNDDDTNGDPVLIFSMWLRHVRDTVNGLGLCTLDKDEIGWPFSGGLLLNNKVVITMELYGYPVAAGSAFPAGQVKCHLTPEIKWVSISKTEMADYIAQFIFTDD